MRDNLPAYLEDDIEQGRYQHWRAKVAKVQEEAKARVLNRHTDMAACKGCGYQRCSCPPEPVEEAGPAGEWRALGGQYSTYSLNGRDIADVAASVEKSGKWYGNIQSGKAEDWFDTEVEAKAWVEEMCNG